MAVTGPPSVKHQGLIVPNAVVSASPRMAEPDQIDFATAANALWGVIEGCHVTVSGTLATMTAGVVLINNKLFPVIQGSVPLGNTPADRFDLIAADTNGKIRLLDGVGAVDPVFPDVPLDCVLLASVFCSGPGPYENTVVDKRRFVSKSLLTKVLVGDKLIQNLNGSGDAYRVYGDGYTVWSEDTRAYRSAPGVLTIEDNLAVSGNVQAGGTLQGGAVRATGLTTGSNLAMQTTAPPLTSPLGSLWQNPALGTLSVMTNDGWKAIGFVADMVPPGTVVMSLESIDNMIQKGWVPLDGREVSEHLYPNLFKIDSLLSVCPHSGTTPDRTMTLPNADGQMLKITSNPAVVLAQGGKSKITLTQAQMPLHSHGVRIEYAGGVTPRAVTTPAGDHTHSITQDGAHTHQINDPKHEHVGVNWLGNRVSLVALAWGGQNKIDALFNDRNHTYSVEAMDRIYEAATNISVLASVDSAHTHSIAAVGGHTHPVTIDAIPSHIHAVSEAMAGGNAEITIDPPYLALHAYIRS
jgi:microcystin-dependent protein